MLWIESALRLRKLSIYTLSREGIESALFVQFVRERAIQAVGSGRGYAVRFNTIHPQE
jgi:hypothetical protein